MNIRHKTIDRIRITGPQSDRTKAFDYLERHGYCIKWSGPGRTAPRHFDETRFAITAEKELNTATELRRDSDVSSGGLLADESKGETR